MSLKLKKKTAFTLIAIAVMLAVSIAVFEVLLQIAHFKSEEVKGTFLEKLTKYTEPPKSWERRFLKRYKMAEKGHVPLLTREGMHKPHPTRGWVLKPNLRARIGPNRYVTNPQGYRSLYNYVYDPGRYGVMIVGDSFTFGDGIDDMITWPYMLGQKDVALNVFNLGGSGYGVGQMYVTLTEEIERYRPNLVIAAFIDDNLHRSMLDFRDYKKPRFIIENGKLILTNTPIGSTEEVIEEIANKRIDNYSAFQTLNVINTLLGRMHATAYIEDPWQHVIDCPEECTRTNEMIIKKMAETARKNNADFLLLYLPRDDEILDNTFTSYGEIFFNNYKDRYSPNSLDIRTEMLLGMWEKTFGHYQKPENMLVSEMVYRKIMELPSRKAFKKE